MASGRDCDKRFCWICARVCGSIVRFVQDSANGFGHRFECFLYDVFFGSEHTNGNQNPLTRPVIRSRHERCPQCPHSRGRRFFNRVAALPSSDKRIERPLLIITAAVRLGVHAAPGSLNQKVTPFSRSHAGRGAVCHWTGRVQNGVARDMWTCRWCYPLSGAHVLS